MKIAIIGAGMGGLTVGIALKKQGHDVTIYEKVTKILPVGAAISLWSNGVKCLNYLGLGEATKRLGGQMDSMAYIDGLDNSTMTQFSLEPLYAHVGQRAYPVARADLQHMLLEAFGREKVHLGMELEQLEQSSDTSITAIFRDGSRVNADLIIGADGTHSTCREFVLGKKTSRRYAGYVNWNGLVKIDEAIAPATQWTTYVGQGKRASVMPIADNRFYFFLDVPLPLGLANERAHYKARLHEHFADWCEPVQRLIASIDETKTNRIEIHDIDPFSTWIKGRCVLLGDAAHSTTPDIGQGGCQAMEDAIYLARSLQINRSGLEDALTRYQDVRSARANELVLRARKRCDVTHMKDEATTQHWYKTLRSEDGENIRQGIAKNIVGNVLD